MDLRERFDRDGFAVVENFVSTEACQTLIDRAESIVDGFDAGEHRSVFTTYEQDRASDDYFLASGGETRFFFEPEAFDEQGELRQAKNLSINKLGHAMHDLDPVFSEFSRTPELAQAAKDVGLDDPRLLQSMYIFKNPYIGGEVTCHQDATFLYTDPITCVGFWFALQDATLENGCLWAIPGGHKKLQKKFVRNEVGNDAAGTSFEVYDADIDATGAVPLEAAAGTLVVLHGLVPHLSGPNRSAKSRHAYSLHCIDAKATYPANNWLQRPASFPLRGF
jgi:phytanoyl-CoA hydroxylase